MKILLSIGLISLLTACSTTPPQATPPKQALNDPVQFETDKEYCKNRTNHTLHTKKQNILDEFYNDCMISRGYLTPGSSSRAIRACVFSGKNEYDTVPWHNGETVTVKKVIERNASICKNPKAPDLLLVG